MASEAVPATSRWSARGATADLSGTRLVLTGACRGAGAVLAASGWSSVGLASAEIVPVTEAVAGPIWRSAPLRDTGFLPAGPGIIGAARDCVAFAPVVSPDVGAGGPGAVLDAVGRVPGDGASACGGTVDASAAAEAAAALPDLTPAERGSIPGRAVWGARGASTGPGAAVGAVACGVLAEPGRLGASVVGVGCRSSVTTTMAAVASPAAASQGQRRCGRGTLG